MVWYLLHMTDTQYPSVFSYLDFRKYLEDYREARKKVDPGFTHTYICFRLGQRNSKSYYANVVKGLKIVTAEFTNRFIEVLGLDVDQASYFRALVNYNQTINPQEKEYYFDQLFRHSAANNRLISPDEYTFYKEWYHSVIRALLDVYDFSDDYEALGRTVVPPITVKQVKDSIKLLESLSLIARDSRGFYKPTEKSVRTDDYVRHELIAQYQMKCLELAKTALLGNQEQPRDISTNIISVSEQGFKRVQKCLQKFRDEVRAVVRNDDQKADRVYQLDVQLFPNSKVFSQRKKHGVFST